MPFWESLWRGKNWTITIQKLMNIKLQIYCCEGILMMINSVKDIGQLKFHKTAFENDRLNNFLLITCIRIGTKVCSKLPQKPPFHSFHWIFFLGAGPPKPPYNGRGNVRRLYQPTVFIKLCLCLQQWSFRKWQNVCRIIFTKFTTAE